jgi:hypothetical protein
MAPENPFERSVWYKAKASECRRIAEVAKLNVIRQSYENMARVNDALAEDAERASRLR